MGVGGGGELKQSVLWGIRKELVAACHISGKRSICIVI